MKRTLFYSWQSDLPNNNNQSFIETSIKQAIKNIDSIDLFLDKATREETGSPDITDSIFKKINKCSVFIADITIINQGNKSRKTPNPNVLIELGYAARTLGWEKIICIFNTDFGVFEDLPFDLRNHRIMRYETEGVIKSKTKSKELLSKQIEQAIISMNEKGLLFDKILDFLKKEIDKEIIGLITHFIRIFYDENERKDLFRNIQDFLDLELEDLISLIEDKQVLGFYIFKSYHEYENKIRDFVNQAMSSQYYNREILNSLIDIYEWFSIYSNHRTKYFDDLFIKSKKNNDDLFVLHSSKISHGSELSDRYLLMKKINEKESKIINFGDFYPGVISDLAFYFKFNKKEIFSFAEVIYMLIKSINNWIDITNKELIVDFVKSFRVRTKEGKWL